MRQTISTLSYEQKLDFSILIFTSLLISIIFILLSFQIEIIYSDVIYVPNHLDYARAILLGSISSFVNNYLYRYISKYIRLLEVWIIFLSLLLLAFPQKTEYSSNSTSKWNLVKREAYLFGVFYSTVSSGFYLFDQLFLAVNDYLLIKDSLESSFEQNSMNESVRQRSTLENCLQIRRNSSNLKKMLYPESYIEVLPYQNTDELVAQVSNSKISNYSSIENESQISKSRSPSTSSVFYNIDYLFGYESILSAIISIRTSQNLISSRLQWIVDHSLWIIVQYIQDIGIALILSITFVYVPSLDDAKFSFLERFYYNRMKLFLSQIVFPVFLITSLLHLSVLYFVWKQLNSSILLTKRLFTITITYICVSIILFIFGIKFG